MSNLGSSEPHTKAMVVSEEYARASGLPPYISPSEVPEGHVLWGEVVTVTRSWEQKPRRVEDDTRRAKYYSRTCYHYTACAYFSDPREPDSPMNPIRYASTGYTCTDPRRYWRFSGPDVDWTIPRPTSVIKTSGQAEAEQERRRRNKQRRPKPTDAPEPHHAAQRARQGRLDAEELEKRRLLVDLEASPEAEWELPAAEAQRRLDRTYAHLEGAQTPQEVAEATQMHAVTYELGGEKGDPEAKKGRVTDADVRHLAEKRQKAFVDDAIAALKLESMRRPLSLRAIRAGLDELRRRLEQYQELSTETHIGAHEAIQKWEDFLATQPQELRAGVERPPTGRPTADRRMVGRSLPAATSARQRTGGRGSERAS